jgi:hypothetical protein
MGGVVPAQAGIQSSIKKIESTDRPASGTMTRNIIDRLVSELRSYLAARYDLKTWIPAGACPRGGETDTLKNH